MQYYRCIFDYLLSFALYSSLDSTGTYMRILCQRKGRTTDEINILCFSDDRREGTGYLGKNHGRLGDEDSELGGDVGMLECWNVLGKERKKVIGEVTASLKFEVTAMTSRRFNAITPCNSIFTLSSIFKSSLPRRRTRLFPDLGGDVGMLECDEEGKNGIY